MADQDIPTSGYKLEMVVANSQDYVVIYNGENLPQGLSYNVTNLTTGSQMSFRLYAMNYNG